VQDADRPPTVEVEDVTVLEGSRDRDGAGHEPVESRDGPLARLGRSVLDPAPLRRVNGDTAPGRVTERSRGSDVVGVRVREQDPPDFVASPPAFTSRNTRAVSPCAPKRFEISRASSIRSTVWIAATRPARTFTLFVWSAPMKCQRTPARSASASAFWRHSCA
jgi:hypothetical protein